MDKPREEERRQAVLEKGAGIFHGDYASVLDDDEAVQAALNEGRGPRDAAQVVPRFTFTEVTGMVLGAIHALAPLLVLIAVAFVALYLLFAYGLR